MATVTITILEDGSIQYLDMPQLRVLEQLGTATKTRASQVHPENLGLRAAFYLLRRMFGENGRVGNFTRRWSCKWMVDLAISDGPVIGPFSVRADAIAAEEAWLTERLAGQ